MKKKLLIILLALTHILCLAVGFGFGLTWFEQAQPETPESEFSGEDGPADTDGLEPEIEPAPGTVDPESPESHTTRATKPAASQSSAATESNIPETTPADTGATEPKTTEPAPPATTEPPAQTDPPATTEPPAQTDPPATTEPPKGGSAVEDRLPDDEL